MKNIINSVLINKDLRRGAVLTLVLVLALTAFFFYSESDLPFVYSQF
ncbi:hypothetical protein UT300005_33390 [Clostridium sp. CTA-5]